MTGGPGRALLEWFTATRRDLPWRGPFPRDPYLVLVSEAMLQQTQVERVVPFFRRFLERFPTVESLAEATADEAVAVFSGLGYYGRARRLHGAARLIVAGGGWPRDAAALRALPGLGSYTGAAVAAFAFGGAEPPVDGNVARVAARWRGLAATAGSASLTRAAEAFAAELHAEAPLPEIFEALIELGATVCTPRSPRCDACPLRPGCRGSLAPHEYPLPRRAATPRAVEWVAVWLEDATGRVLLRRAPDGGLLAGLWLPPFTLGSDGLKVEAAAELAAAFGYMGPLAALAVVRHSITHHRIAVHPFKALLAPGTHERPGDLALRDPASPGVPTSSLLAKLHRVCSLPPLPPGQPRERPRAPTRGDP